MSSLDVHRFLGISVAGGKTGKTALALLEYFPEHEKVFLSRLVSQIGEKGAKSPDWHLVELLKDYQKSVESVAVDAPLGLPKCIPCEIRCPGFEKCRVGEVKWMRERHLKREKKKRPNKAFTSYTQRAIEIVLAEDLEEAFHISHALGANSAPRAARMQYLQKRLKLPFVEVEPGLSVWRIGRALKIAKSHLKFHKHSVSGEVSREVFLQALCDVNAAFFYQQDLKTMISNNSSFEAFINSYTAFLEFQELCEKRPKSFPRTADWIRFPIQDLAW